MIKANELRIGNWVFADEKPYQIKHISPDDEWQPIPLTPEILEKAGFVKDLYGWDDKDLYRWHMGYNIYVYDDMHVSLQGWVGGINGYERVEHLKYLHQLQNLYFALTGEELMIENMEDKRSVATKSNSSNEDDQLKKLCDLYGVPPEILPKETPK